MALPSGWSVESAAAEALEAGWRSPPLLEDTTKIVGREWRQLMTPSLREGGFNEISHVRLADSDDAAIEAWLDARIAEYRGARFRVVIGPGTRPADLAERLARRGFTRIETCAMARDLSPLPDRTGEIVAERMIDEAGAERFTSVLAEGWSLDPSPLREMHRRMLATPSRRLYVARVDGAPAGAAATHLEGASAYLLGAVTLPRFRGRGVYQALVARRIADAARSGAQLATSQARADTSAPILAKLGFETVARFPMMTSR